MALYLAVFQFDPDKHPRTFNGRWAKVSERITSKPVGDRFSAKAKSLPTDTQDLHTERGADGQWRYTPQRAALHKDIAESFLKGKPVIPEGERVALFTAGGTAAGKSTVIGGKDSPVEIPEGAVHVDPDAVKALLPEYKHMVEKGDTRAAMLAHEESSDIAKMVTKLAQQRGHHVFIDGTGNSSPGKFAGKISDMHKRGYKARVAYVTVPTDEAIKRADARAQRTGRAVPEQSIRYLHAKVSEFFPDVAQIAKDLDALTVHENKGTSPKRIAHLENGKLVHDSPEEMKAFLAKAKEKYDRQVQH